MTKAQKYEALQELRQSFEDVCIYNADDYKFSPLYNMIKEFLTKAEELDGLIGDEMDEYMDE